MSFFVRIMMMASLLLLGGEIMYAQENTETQEILEEGQKISARVVRINPESEVIEASERIVESFEGDLGEKIPQEQATQIDFVMEVFIDLNTSAQEVLDELVENTDAFIEEVINLIRTEKPQSPYALRRLVDPIRDDIYVEIENRLGDFDLLNDPTLFVEQITFLRDRLDLIEETLERKGEVDVVVDLQKDLSIASLEVYGKTLTESNRRLTESSLLSVITDSDDDGLSDFTEEIITHTNPRKQSTIGGSSTDQEVLLLGQNANSLDLEDTLYTDISKSTSGAHISLMQLKDVQQRKSINNEKGTILLQGISIPASVVYGYILPENVVFITQTDRFGLWEYTLTRELLKGEYKVLLGHLEADGAPVARSKSYTFIHGDQVTYLEGKPVGAVTVIDSDSPGRSLIDDLNAVGNSPSSQHPLSQGPLADFVREYFLVIVGALALLGIFVSFILMKSGHHKRTRAYYSAMSPDGPTINEAKGGSLYGVLDEE